MWPSVQVARSEAPRCPAPSRVGPLKICQFASAATSVFHLLKDQILGLQARGHQVRALSGPLEGAPWEVEASRAGFVHDTGPIRREIAPAHDARALAWLIRYFRRHRFDVVHTHTPKAGLIGPMAARLAGVPLVVHTVHGFLFHSQTPWANRCVGWLAEKWTASWVDSLLFQSREDYGNAARLHILDAERCRYVGNGVNVDRYRRRYGPGERARRRAAFGIGPTDFVIGYVGRLVREKGVLDLLGAFEEISRVYPEARLLVFGVLEVASQKDSLTARDLDDWRRRMPVTFAGYRADVDQLYPLLDLFVLPSYREGLPRALVEACIAGVPVIATRIRGNSEVVQDGATGLLYAPGDVAELARKLETVLTGRAAAEKRAEAARIFAATHFDERLVLERIAQAYEELFSLARRRRFFREFLPHEGWMQNDEPADF